MGKDKSFSAKLAKASGTNLAHCPTCGEAYDHIHVIETVRNEEKNSYKFKETFVPMCKCNQKDVME